MTVEYNYQPPFKYLAVGLSGLLLSIIFGIAIDKDKVWFSFLMGLFCLVTLAIGIGFLLLFIKRFNIGNLILCVDFIEIPRRWKKQIRLNFDEISDIYSLCTYDNIIEIRSIKGIYIIEENFMKQKDFEDLKRKLQEYWNNK